MQFAAGKGKEKTKPKYIFKSKLLWKSKWKSEEVSLWIVYFSKYSIFLQIQIYQDVDL